jgi:hydroxyacylglutathione hydrolase
LVAILLTHDHNDHVGGVDDILNLFPAPVYGNCAKSTIMVNNNQKLKLFKQVDTTVLYIPGHTNNSICFLLNINQQYHLFSGDTLFAMGCGRVFTNDYMAMFNSLNLIMNLPATTIIYPAHEYTMANIEPNNNLIYEREVHEQNKLKLQQITLPIILQEEVKTNQFLRFNDAELAKALSNKLNKNVEKGFDCFYNLRQLKDNY